MYKIKFLERIKTNKKGNKPEEKFMTVSYGEADLLTAAVHWRAMGFLEIRDIEVFQNAKKTAVEIIEMFYAEKAIVNGKETLMNLDEEDKEIKKSLLQKYSNKKNVSQPKPDIIPDELKEMDTEKEKELRKKLFTAFAEKNVKVMKNLKTEVLIAKAKENNIEI